MELLSTPDFDDVLWMKAEFLSRFQKLCVVRLIVEESSEESLVGAGYDNPHVFDRVGVSFELFSVVEDEFDGISFLYGEPNLVRGDGFLEKPFILPAVEFDDFDLVAIFLKCGVGVFFFFAHDGLTVVCDGLYQRSHIFWLGRWKNSMT